VTGALANPVAWLALRETRIGDRLLNAEQSWFDAATGTPRTGIIASLQASKAEMIQLNLEQADPKACFRHLKGIATPSVEQVTAVRPIFVLNKDDQRIVKEKDVAGGLASEANLAAMPWDDFEHLVRQLFEWEFGRNGVEVKVTRASRDRGVDAIMFDPDPLRGGKYVLQAKRYTRPVDVAAVRDLYGTVVNEGANRGILVTTSSYGPDAYEFAKDKPLSLVDGPNLIAMLQRHGRRYRIDLAEARRLAALDDSRVRDSTEQEEMR
jgi:restriction system protein